MLNKMKIYLQELRAPFLTVTIIPVIIGTIIGVKEINKFNPENFIFILLGFIFLHLETNVLNDYFDYKNGTDNVNNEYIFPFTGGSRLIQLGKILPGEVLIEGIILYIGGIVFFMPLIVKYGLIIFFILILALISGIFYTAPPFKWAYMGLGEILIFLCFGPLMVLTSYYVQGGHDNLLNVFLLSISLGLFAASIIEINQFPDFTADKMTDKKNLLVRFGVDKGKYLFILSIFIAYFLILLCVYLKIISYFGLIIVLTIPVAIKAMKILFKNYNQPLKLAPACSMTILLHFINGIIIIFGVVIN